MLSRVNHKNFVNLIGYCEEDEPFTRMMVFEYAPNGQLSEHLHGKLQQLSELVGYKRAFNKKLNYIFLTFWLLVKEAEHLDWITRVRIVMGIAYCLHYMHHDLNPPVAHTHLTTSSIYLTDDYAAKVNFTT